MSLNDQNITVHAISLNGQCFLSRGKLFYTTSETFVERCGGRATDMFGLFLICCRAWKTMTFDTHLSMIMHKVGEY